MSKKTTSESPKKSSKSVIQIKGQKGAPITVNSVANSLNSNKWKDPKKWPKNLHDFIGRSFKLASKKKFNENELNQFKNQLKNLINIAINSGKILENDWDKQELPILAGAGYKRLALYCDELEQSVKRKRRNETTDDSNINDRKRVNIFGEEESESETENNAEGESLVTKKKETNISLGESLKRLKKHKKETVIRDTSINSNTNDNNKNFTNNTTNNNSQNKLTDEERKALRSKRFERELSVQSTNDSDNTMISTDPIIGRNQNLEKKYLRLTSQPNPETVRPLDVLHKTLQLLFDKKFEGASYNYLCDQCKSLRQDLTVQNIKTDFSIMAYEFHSKLAIENSDWGEFNQCQSQLKVLYSDSGLNKPNFFEFLSYRILYYILTGNINEVFELELSLLNDGYENLDNKYLNYAFKIFKCIVNSDYYLLSQIVDEIFNENENNEKLFDKGGFISINDENALLLKHNNMFYFTKFVENIIERENIRTLSIICKGYRQIPISYLKEILCSGDNNEKFENFLELNHLKSFVNDGNSIFNCISARATVDSLMNKTFRKIDIKGQI